MPHNLQPLNSNWQLKDGKRSKYNWMWNVQQKSECAKMCVLFVCDNYLLSAADYSSKHSKQTFSILKTDFWVFLLLLFLVQCESEKCIHVVDSPIVLDDYTNMVWSLHAFGYFNFIYFKLTLNMLQQYVCAFSTQQTIHIAFFWLLHLWLIVDSFLLHSFSIFWSSSFYQSFIIP